MSLRINTNVNSLGAQRALLQTGRKLNSTLKRLSSGQRIVQSGDDAAGLAISENLRAQVRGLRQAKRNASDGISLIQIAEGGLNEISDIIIRLRELSIQASSDTVGNDERGFSDVEFQQLKEEIDRISSSAEFNGTKLLDGTSGILEFQVGTGNNPSIDRLQFNGSQNSATTGALGLQLDEIGTKQGAQGSLKKLDSALVQINRIRANLGATQNRLSSTIRNLARADENLSAANSRIRDADIAKETAELAKNNVLMQSGVSVLSQANQAPTIALKLLG